MWQNNNQGGYIMMDDLPVMKNENDVTLKSCRPNLPQRVAEFSTMLGGVGDDSADLYNTGWIHHTFMHIKWVKLTKR